VTTGKARKRTQAITALLTSRTLDAAAAACQVSKRTLIRWLQDEGFKREYEQAKDELLESTINALRGNGFEAAAVLRRIAKNPKAPFAARVSAARANIETLLRGVELQDLERRLRVLEELGKGN